MPKSIVRLQFKRRQSGQVKRQRHVSRGAQVAERGGIRGGIVPLPAGEGGYTPSQKFFLLFDLKMEHFGAVFKLD